MNKKIICGLLAALMIFLLLPMQAFAAEKVVGAYVDRAFENALGTIAGAERFSYSGTLPDGLSLRGEMRYSHDQEMNLLTVFLSGTPTKAGTYSFDVNYKDKDGNSVKKVSYSITVGETAPFAYMHSIDVYKWPDKLEYYPGEEINTKGMIVYATVYKLNKDGTAYEPFTYDVTDMAWIKPGYVDTDNVDGMNIEVFVSAPADQQGNIDTFSSHFRITVKRVDPSTITRVEIYKAPTKLTYTVGETLDLTGMQIRIHKGDGTAQDVTTGYTVDTTKLEEVGTKTVTITYGEGDNAPTATFDVTVTEAVSSEPSSSASTSSSSSSQPESSSEPEPSSEPEEPSSESEPVEEPSSESEPAVEEPIVSEPESSEPDEVVVMGDGEIDDDDNEKSGIPFWVWIIIALLVLLIAAAVALFLIGRKRIDDEY